MYHTELLEFVFLIDFFCFVLTFSSCCCCFYTRLSLVDIQCLNKHVNVSFTKLINIKTKGFFPLDFYFILLSFPGSQNCLSFLFTLILDN